jgi:hypothetical protein
MPRKQQPKPTRRFEWIGVGAVAVVALALRLAGIGWGLPNSQHYFSYHPDEIFLLMPAFGFAQGDWNPHFFNYGTLYIYLVGIPAVALHLVPDSVRFPLGLAPLYLAGRIVTALLGAATIPVLYLALRRESKPHAWGSALLLAICPLHVINSHYATVDVPATFFITLAFLFALRGADQPTLKHAALAGFFVGLAAATKYNAALFLVPAMLAPMLARKARPGPAWWAGVPVAAALTFRLCNPWVGTPEFRQGFLFELRHAQIGGTLAFVNSGSGWGYHLLHGLPVALGYPLLAALAVGLVLSFRSKSPAARMSLLWCLLYFLAIGFSKERFIRYLVPMMPFVCVLAASAASRLRSDVLSRHRLRVARTVAVSVVALTAAYAIGQVMPLALPWDPRDDAMRADQPLRIVRPRLRPDRSVSVGPPRVGLVQAPWYADPPVSPYNAGAFSAPAFEAWNAANGHPVVVTGWSVHALRREAPDAVALSDLESSDVFRLRMPDAVEFRDALNLFYEHQTIYERGSHPFSWLAPPRLWAPPDWLYPVPVIRVFDEPRP